MPPTLTLCRTGLTGAAAAVLLGACGGGGSTTGDDSSSASAASAAPSSPGPTGASSSSTGAAPGASSSEFCAQALQLQTQLQSLAPNLTDPAATGQALQQVAAAVSSIDPPPQIAADWTALATGVQQLAQIFRTTDLTNPQQAAAAQQQAAQLQAQLSSASTNVTNYLGSACGLTSSSPSTAPTS